MLPPFTKRARRPTLRGQMASGIAFRLMLMCLVSNCILLIARLAAEAQWAGVISRHASSACFPIMFRLNA